MFPFDAQAQPQPQQGGGLLGGLPGVNPNFMDNPLLHGGFLTRAGLVDRYRAGTGFDLSGLRWYEVFAFFKIAVIVEQIYARYVAGQTSDQRFADFGTRVERLSAAALELAEG